MSLRRILPIVLIAAIAASAYLLDIRRDMSDFGVGFQAGDRILSGETLYRTSDGHLQFKYAPAAALFYAPFSLLPWEAAKAAWFLVMAGCLAGILFNLARWASGRGVRTGSPLVWTVIVLAKFLGRELELGQVNLLILFLLVLMAREIEAGRESRAGLLWGLSLFFKPYGIVFFPYFILKKKLGVIAAGGVALLAGLSLPVVAYGWNGNGLALGEWVRTLSQSTPGLLRVGDNASLFAFFAKALPISDTMAMILGGIAAAGLGAMLLLLMLMGKREKIEGAGFTDAAALMALIPMLSPLGWNYNYLYGLPAVFALLSVWPRFRKGEQAALAANFALIGGTLREILGKSVFRFYTRQALVVPSFLFVFVMLFVARRRRIL